MKVKIFFFSFSFFFLNMGIFISDLVNLIFALGKGADIRPHNRPRKIHDVDALFCLECCFTSMANSCHVMTVI